MAECATCGQEKPARYEHRRIPGTFGGCKVWQIFEDGKEREHDGECYTVKGAEKYAVALNKREGKK